MDELDARLPGRGPSQQVTRGPIYPSWPWVLVMVALGVLSGGLLVWAS